MRKACVAIIRNDNNEILLLNRNSKPYGYGLPGGKQEEGESLLQCVIREIKEETGLVLLSAIYDKQCISASGDFEVHVFEGIPENFNVILSGEHSEFIWKTINELNEEDIELAGNTPKFLEL